MNFVHTSTWSRASNDLRSFRLGMLASAVAMTFSAGTAAQPTGGIVSAGMAAIGGTPAHMTITQTTPNVAINWNSFNIGAGQSVQFVQPGSNAVALNRVISSEPSSILGSLSSNGRVFLVNPNGVLFGQGASVNVGGLVASTLGISDANFMAGNYKFSDGGTGTGSIVNHGTINAASGGYVALLGANVSNQGLISARLGTVALAAGSAMTLDMAGDKLLSVTVDQGAFNATVENGGTVRADGGRVLLTTQAAGSLLSNAVNNTGLIQAQTVENVEGTIKLLAGMQTGTMNVNGTLDGSAPQGGNGGFIETSAANVRISGGANVSTLAPRGLTGTWLIDPQDFIVGGNATDNISGATLSALLVTNSVTISTNTGHDATSPGAPPSSSLYSATPGNGDIHINQAVSWSASSTPTVLTLNAARDININAPITATNGSLATCCGRDVNVRAPITTVRGSVLLAGGRDINMMAAITTTDGNIAMCAAGNINIFDKLTLTRGTTIPERSLGLPLGLLLNAGYGGNGPGIDAGTVIFATLAPAMTVTGPNAPVTINYNPVSYTLPTDYSGMFILTGAATVSQHMLVFAGGGDKNFDGGTATTLSALMGNPSGVTLVAGPGSSANFDSADVGLGKRITFTGFSLAGADAANYALAAACCGPVGNTTTGNIRSASAATPGGTIVGTIAGTTAGTTAGIDGSTNPLIATVPGARDTSRTPGLRGRTVSATPSDGSTSTLTSEPVYSFTQLPSQPIFALPVAAHLALNVVHAEAPVTILRVVEPPPTSIDRAQGSAPQPLPLREYVVPQRPRKQDRH